MKKNKKRNKKGQFKKRISLIEFLAAIFALGVVGSLLIFTIIARPVEAKFETKLNEVTGFVPITLNTEILNETQALPFELPSDLTSKQKYINIFLETKNEDIERWNKIIKAESDFNPYSEAPTYWSLCDQPVSVNLWGVTQPANRFIELRDYPNGIWQATCEENGARTIKTGYSGGLTHIIQTTWDQLACSGNVFNWIDNLNCAFKIRDAQGWQAWSTN